MTLATSPVLDAASSGYARCIERSKQVRWNLDDDLLRGRRFDLGRPFLPEGLSRVGRLEFLSAEERRLLSQVQGRTYANVFGLVERFIGALVTDRGREHALGDQVAFEALVRFTDEELKHQELFRRMERMLAEAMPAGYVFTADPDAVARAVLAASPWAVLGLTCHIELFTLAHYRASIEPNASLCELFRDVFRFHWIEESQHAILDELEWRREDRRLSAAERDRAVDDLIGLVGAVDGILQAQSAEDARWFGQACGRALPAEQFVRVRDGLLAAYRWQYIVSGATDPRFGAILGSLTTAEQARRVQAALAPLVAAADGARS